MTNAEETSRWWAAGVRGVPGAAREVVDLTSRLSGLRTWYCARFIGHAVVPVAVSPRAVGVSVGTPISWEGTVCRRMVSRLGPHLVPDVSAVPNYARAEMAVDLGIRAYAGVPLLTGSSDLVGVLSGWDDHPVDRFSDDLESVMWTLGRLLAEVAEVALERDEIARQQDREARAARGFHTTGRRQWGQILEAEETRTRENASQAGVLLIDFGLARSSGALQTATLTVAEANRGSVLARLSARHVGVLLIGEELGRVAEIAALSSSALDLAGFEPITSWALATEAQGLESTWMLAEDRLLAARQGAAR